MTMRPTYDRNSFADILRVAQELGLRRRTNSLLTIGERDLDAKIVDAYKLGFKITVVEAFEGNIRRLKSAAPNWTVMHLNAADLPNSEIPLNEFDLVWWYHGPEHLSKPVGLELFRFLKQHANFVISSMPHGAYEQGELYGNPYEKHISEWFSADFIDFGGKVFTESNAGNDKTSLDVFIKGDLNWDTSNMVDGEINRRDLE